MEAKIQMNQMNPYPHYNLYQFHIKPTKTCLSHKLIQHIYSSLGVWIDDSGFLFCFLRSPVDSPRVYEVAPSISELRAEEWCAATWSRRFIGWPSLP